MDFNGLYSLRTLTLTLTLTLFAAASAENTSAAAEPKLTHGAAVGEVTDSGALVWFRTNEATEALVTVGEQELRASTSRDADFTARVRFKGLLPSTRYAFTVRVGSDLVEGSFRTAPAPAAGATSSSTAEPIRFVFGGDLGGHGYCREKDQGYEIFATMELLEPDFFIANGDMIYADNACPEERPDGGRNVPGTFPPVDAPHVNWTNASAVRDIFLAHWRYNRADEHFQRFLLHVPVYVQWDDHEVINDFGAEWPTLSASPERAGYPTLVREGRRALFDFHPIESEEKEEPYRIYRSFRWGPLLELFLLDARSYRSWNDLVDRPEAKKTLLGEAQLAWLKRGLSSSNAVWKVVSTDVPLSLPTGSFAHRLGRDAWASGTDDDFSSRTGFERELADLLGHLDRTDTQNVVFVATDVHYAMTLRYETDVDGDGDELIFHELVSGPLSAVRLHPAAPDPTFRPRILYAEGDLFNYGFVQILPGDREAGSPSRLEADVRDANGKARRGSQLSIEAIDDTR